MFSLPKKHSFVKNFRLINDTLSLSQKRQPLVIVAFVTKEKQGSG